MKNKFHQYKGPISINDVDISKIVISNSVGFGKNGFKLFIGFNDGKKVSEYRRDFDQTKYLSFLKKNDELLEKYEIWNKVSKVIIKGFLIVSLYIIINIWKLK